MRPGSLVLFIDNAAGGFTQVIERAGRKSNFRIIAGPYKHMEYSNEDLKIERFGYTSCFQTKVTIILMQKPGKFQAPSPAHPALSSQNTYKVPLRDIQNISQVPSQEKIIKSLLRDGTQSPSEASNASLSISSAKRKAPLPSAEYSTKKLSSQATQELNISLSRSSIRSSTSRSISSGNVIRPVSNTSTVKINNLDHQPKRYTPQAISSSPRFYPQETSISRRFNPQATRSSLSPGSNASTRPFISSPSSSERVPAYERDDNPDSCCSCCVIS